MNEDGTWPVDRILKVKKVAGVKKYLVRWQDWSPDYDFWEPAKNVARDVIADFKDELAERERDEAKVAKQPRREPAPPFSVSEANAESADVKAVRVADAAVLLEDISSDVGELTSRQQKPKAEMKIYHTKPISSAFYVGLHTYLGNRAKELEPDEKLEDMVSAITVHRRGVRPIDTFLVSATAPRGDYLLQLLPPLLLRSLTASPPCSPLHRPALRSPPCSPLSSVLSVWQILDDGLLNDIFGHKVLKLQEQSGMAVKLFAPIDIELRGRRVNEAGELDKAGELVRVKELVVKGHYTVASSPTWSTRGQPHLPAGHRGLRVPR